MKERLEQMKKQYYENMSSHAKDFVEDYGDYDMYISDAFSEFADNNTSCYYSDQKNFFEEHTSECEDALENLGYDLNDLLKSCHGSLSQFICKIGAIGEYESIYQELYNSEEDIIKYLATCYVLDYLNQFKESVIEFIDTLTYRDANRFSDIWDTLDSERKEGE